MTQKQNEHELTEEFIRSRQQHSSVESAINALENHGLDRCPDKGIDAFKRYISLAVLSRNIQITGNLLQQKKRTEEERKKKYRQTWESNQTNARQVIKAAWPAGHGAVVDFSMVPEKRDFPFRHYIENWYHVT